MCRGKRHMIHGTRCTAPRCLPMQIEQVKLVGVVEIPLQPGRKAVALMFDNMRWMLDFSTDPATYQKRRAEIGSMVTFIEDEARELSVRLHAAGDGKN
jgi:hypothetical protein